MPITKSLNFVLLFLVVVVNMASQMKFANSELLYLMKFVLFVIHLSFMFLIIIKEKIVIPNQIKFIGSLFYIWFFIMVISTYHLNSFGEVMSAFMVIISYILLFLYSFIVFPNYMLHQNISYITIMKIAYLAVVTAIVGAVVLGLGRPESTHFDPYSLRNRYMAFFQHPNTLGLYSFMAVCLSFILFKLKKSVWYIIPYPLFIYLVYLSSSRTALYCTIIFIVITFFSEQFTKILKMTKNPLFFTFSFCLIALGLLLIDWPALLQAIDEGTSNRLTVWTELINQSDSMTKLLFGQGAAKTDSSKDNYYVLVLINSGIVGLFVFLMIIIYVLKVMIEKVDVNKLSRILIIIYSIIIVYSLAESIFFTLGNVFSLLLWISVAFSLYETSSRPVKLQLTR